MKIQPGFPGRMNMFIYKYDKYFLQKIPEILKNNSTGIF